MNFPVHLICTFFYNLLLFFFVYVHTDVPLDSPASAAKISKADTPPQEYSDAETDKTVSDRGEEGDNASDGVAVDTE